MSCGKRLSLDILIPTRDRPLRLAACLASLAAQDLSFIEGEKRLYLLDNGGTSVFTASEVARYLDALEMRGIATTYLRQPKRCGIFWIRRELYQRSSGDIVLHLDDDVLLAAGSVADVWEGVVDTGFNLAANFVIDVDGLSRETITHSSTNLKQSIEYLVEQIRGGRIGFQGDHWIEMTEPFGTNIMFRRADFDGLGAWDRLLPLFGDSSMGWGEDSALCVALKTLGSAYVSVREAVLHFTPSERYFTSFENSEGFKEFLCENFGGWNPSQIRNKPSDREGDVEMIIRQLESYFRASWR